MATGQLTSVLRHLHKLAGAVDRETLSDAQLLERFIDKRDEAAFALLVQRHGPMVLGVCRRVLQNTHDAEDAFQATFLLLVRKAETIDKGAALAGWLHEVAVKMALRARAKGASRRQHESRVPPMAEQDSIAAVVWRDLQPILDQEVQRLPEKIRTPFVLCYLEGKTYAAAAKQLGCASGTISQRLNQARKTLRTRLARRGLALPAGLLATALTQNIAPAALPATLTTSTVQAAVASAGNGALAGVSASVAALVRGGLRGMATTKTRMALGVLLCLGALTLGMHALTPAAPPAALPDTLRDAAVRQEVPPINRFAGLLHPEQAAGKKAVPQPGKQMTVTGQVLSAEGKPLANADVAVLTWAKVASPYPNIQVPLEVLGQGKTDANGRFQIAVVRTSSKTHYSVIVVARDAEHGLTQTVVGVDNPQPDVQLRLPRAMTLRGRVLDLQGLPVAGAQIHVVTVGYASRPPRHTLQFYQPPRGLAAWPAAATTDADGLFTLRGVHKGDSLVLYAVHERFARQTLVVNPDDYDRSLLDNRKQVGQPTPYVELKFKEPDRPEPFTWVLTPARTFEGTVVRADNKTPVANCRVLVYAGKLFATGMPEDRTETTTDEQGRYQIIPQDGTYYSIMAFPPAGEPYLPEVRRFNWSNQAAVRQTLDVALRRGVVVRGKVSEAESRKPLAGASVEHVPQLLDNPFSSGRDLELPLEMKSIPFSGEDGTFQIIVPPGPGHLLVNAPTPDYLRHETSEHELHYKKPGERRLYPNALVKLDLKAQATEHEANVALRRGLAVKVRVLGPDGEPVAAAEVFYRSYILQGYLVERLSKLHVKDGEVELPGLDPDVPQPVFFLNAEKQLGAVVELPGKEAEPGPVTVRLQRCGTVTARFIDAEGKPIQNARHALELLITPGADLLTAVVEKKLAADRVPAGNLDQKRYSLMLVDKNGRITLPTLIPNAEYRLYGSIPPRGFRGSLRTFRVQPGQDLSLGDIVLTPPE